MASPSDPDPAVFFSVLHLDLSDRCKVPLGSRQPLDGGRADPPALGSLAPKGTVKPAEVAAGARDGEVDVRGRLDLGDG